MAISINYLNPATGAVAPTFLQSLGVNTVIATVFPTSSPDTAAVITHDFQMPAADISAGWPQVIIEPIDSLALASDWWVQSVDPNYLGLARLTSLAGQDTVPQIKVFVSRPWTGSR